MHDGTLVVAGGYHGRWMTEVIRDLRGHHEPQEEAVFHQIVQRLRADTDQPVMVELGAFWAYYTLWLKRAIPGARCLIVEPDPAGLQLGLRNAALNRVEVEALQAAVGAGELESVSFRCEPGGQTVQVPVVSVPGLFQAYGLDRIDLLHCDTQGAELAMLEGAEEPLRNRRIRFIVVSTHDESISGDGQTHQRCLQILRGHGAHLIAEHSVEESASGDGLIAASLDPRDRDLTVEVSRVDPARSLFAHSANRQAQE